MNNMWLVDYIYYKSYKVGLWNRNFGEPWIYCFYVFLHMLNFTLLGIYTYVKYFFGRDILNVCVGEEYILLGINILIMGGLFIVYEVYGRGKYVLDKFNKVNTQKNIYGFSAGWVLVIALGVPVFFSLSGCILLLMADGTNE